METTGRELQPDIATDYGLTENERVFLEMYEGRENELGGFITPEQGQERLRKLGYDETMWEQIVTDKIGAHETRMYAIVALGDTPRLDYVVSLNLRAIDYLEGDPGLVNNTGIGPTLAETSFHTNALRKAIDSLAVRTVMGNDADIC